MWPAPPPLAQRLWSEIFDAADVDRPGLPRLRPDREFARTEDGLTALLSGAGLTDVHTRTLGWELQIHPDDWWSGPAHGIAGPGLVLEHQPPSAIPAVRAAYDRLTAPYRRPDGLLHLPTAALLAAATA